MSEAERQDYERTIAELRTSRDAWPIFLIVLIARIATKLVDEAL